MSFFSKFQDKAEGYLNKDKSSQQANYPQQPRYSTPPPQQYNQTPPPQQYSQAPPPGQYNQQQYNQSYGAPPQQQYGQPQGGSYPSPPHVPQGWQPLWDPSQQRWAFLELSTSRVNFNGPYSQDGGCGSRDAYGQPPAQSYEAVPVAAVVVSDKEDHNGRNVALGAAGGLAVGAIGGALIMDAVDDHEEDERRENQQNFGGGAPFGNEPLPTHDNDGDSVSSSDREDVEEAREAYEEAYEEAYDD